MYSKLYTSTRLFPGLLLLSWKSSCNEVVRFDLRTLLTSADDRCSELRITRYTGATAAAAEGRTLYHRLKL